MQLQPMYQDLVFRIKNLAVKTKAHHYHWLIMYFLHLILQIKLDNYHY
jgi:hypothetical protein